MTFPLAIFGLVGIWSWLAYAAVSIGFSYIGGKLFGQDLKEAEAEPEGQSFAWEPHTTQAEGIPHPMCYGRNMHYGNLVARWTDVDPLGDELLYMLLDQGQGPVQDVPVDLEAGDTNLCLAGTPIFNDLYDENIDYWYNTAANMNDGDKTTYVGCYGKGGGTTRGKYEAVVEFDSSTVDRIEYRRWWILKGHSIHQGYEKTYLWYDGSYHLVSTKNITTEGEHTDLFVIEAGGPWEGVTKIKIEVEIWAKKKFRGEADDGKAGHRLFEIAAWLLRDVDSPVYFNDQPIRNFKQVHVQSRQGTLNQTCMDGFEQNKLEYMPGAPIVYNEPVTWSTPNTFADDVEYTLSFPRGLHRYDDTGDLESHSVGVKVEIRERGSEGAWDELFNENITAAQTEPLYKAYRVNALVPDTVVHGTQYDLRFSMTTEQTDSRRIGDLELRSVREVIDVAFTRPGKVLLGVTALATPQLSGRIDVKWIAGGKLVPVYDSEGDCTIEHTRNRAWIVLAILSQPVISGDGNGNPWVIERYDGLQPLRLDLSKWYEWSQFCDALVPSGVGEETEKRMTCDIICDQLTSVWSIAYKIAQVGRMYPYWQGVMLTGWIDKVTAEDIDLITMDNTMANSWKSSYAGYGEMAGSLEIFYKDSQQGYARKPRPVHNENAGLYTRIIKLEGIGVTSESLATRVGNHALKRNELIKNINNVRMGREALRYRLGRVVRIQSNVPNWGQAFRVITSPTSSTVELDRIIENVSPGDLFWVKTSHVTTKVVGLNCYMVQSVAGKVVTITTIWTAGRTPLKDHLAAIGIAGSIKLRRIIKMEPTVENYFNVELETYDTDLFLSDGVDPVLTNPDFVQPAPMMAQPITRDEVVSLVTTRVNTALLGTITDKPQLANCAWSGNDVDTVEWSKLNADEPILLKWQGVAHEITPADTALEFIYWDMDNFDEFKTTADSAVALAAGMYLVCTNKAGVPQPADMTQTQHGAIIQPKTITATLEQLDDDVVETPKVKGLAITTPKIAENAVTQEYGEHITPVSVTPISSSGTTICGPIEITTVGGDVKLTVTTYYGADPGDDDFWCFFRQDGDPIESAGYHSVTALAAWPDLMCFTKQYRVTSLDAGTYEFSVMGFCTEDDVVVGDRFFTVQELKK